MVDVSLVVPRRRLLFLAFLVGTVITAAELSATPLLAPAFGTSLIVWTCVIGVFLAALAVGYAAGGRLADRSKNLRPLLYAVALGGALLALVPFFAKALFVAGSLADLIGGQASLQTVLAVFTAMLLLFALPMALLAMTSPFVIAHLQRASAPDQAGRITGRVFAFSTIGSVLGVFLGPLVLLPLIGTRGTFLLAGGLLVISAFVGLAHSPFVKSGGIAVVVALVMFALPLLSPISTHAGTIEEGESFLQYVRVFRADDGSIRMQTNEGLGAQSILRPGSPYNGTYTDFFPLLPLSRLHQHPAGSPIDVLLIGVAGGSIARTLDATVGRTHVLAIDGVEVDPLVSRLARKHFSLDDIPSLSVTIEDGRSYLRRTDKSYDYIFVDAFQNESTIPPELATREFFETIQTHLKPGGMVAMNVVTLSSDTPLLLAIENTLAVTFPSVFAASVPGYANVFLFASAESSTFDPSQAQTASLPVELEGFRSSVVSARPIRYDGSRRVLTDDRSPVALLTASMFFREATLSKP